MKIKRINLCVSFRILSRCFCSRPVCGSRWRSGAGTRSESVLDETAVNNTPCHIQTKPAKLQSATCLTKMCQETLIILHNLNIREAVDVSHNPVFKKSQKLAQTKEIWTTAFLACTFIGLVTIYARQ